ncbi:MAG: hypothetical protein KF878_23325 [Planctomycetes bacterium]|nr:hypothetical protein [Planctomycetota bacterium]
MRARPLEPRQGALVGPARAGLRVQHLPAREQGQRGAVEEAHVDAARLQVEELAVRGVERGRAHPGARLA